jgi:hypothetical protein
MPTFAGIHDWESSAAVRGASEMELLAVGRTGKHVNDVTGVERGTRARHGHGLARPHRRWRQVRIGRLMRGVGRARGKPQVT